LGKGKLTIIRNIVIDKKPNFHKHAVFRFAICRSNHHHIYQHASLEQRKERPLIIIINIPTLRPCRNQIIEQTLNRLSNVRCDIRAGIIYPPTINSISNLEDPKLAEKPYQTRRNCGRQHESGYSSKGRFSDAGETGLLFAVATLSNRLESADVTGYEGKDGDTNSTLKEDTDDGVLKQSRGCVFRGGGFEELFIEGTGDVGEDYKERREATQALNQGIR